MLIFEKNNKLNINFDPSKSIEGTPDIQVGENEISVAGNNIVSGGGSEPLVVTFSGVSDDNPTYDTATCDKTWEEIVAAGKNVRLFYKYYESYIELQPTFSDSSVTGTYYYFDGYTDMSGVWSYTRINCTIQDEYLFCSYHSESSD